MIKIITHRDLDGSGCAIVIKSLTVEDIDVTHCSYNNVDEITLEAIKNHKMYSKIYITDISVSETVAKELDKIKGKVVLIDHHPTAEWLNKYDWATVQIEQEEGKACGTTLVYKYLTQENKLVNPSMELFTELVRRFDTWEWVEKYNDEAAKKLNDLFYIKGIECFMEDMIEKLSNNYPIFSNAEITFLDWRQKEIDRYIDGKNKDLIVTKILDYKAGIVFADNHISELGNKLSTLNPDLDFIAIIKQKTVSYRTTKENVDLTKVAKYFGGGGHPKASGSQIDQKYIYKFTDELFKKRTLRDLLNPITSIFKKVN